MRIPGASAATQPRRRGSRPKEPAGVSATMRETLASSTKTWKGKSTLSCMRGGGMFRLRSRRCSTRLDQWLGRRIGRGPGRSGRRCGRCLRIRLDFRFADRPDHIERALRHAVELVVQDALAAIECVLQTDHLSGEAGELLGREEGLGQEALEAASPRDDVAVLRRQLLEAKHLSLI